MARFPAISSFSFPVVILISPFISLLAFAVGFFVCLFVFVLLRIK